MGGCHPKTANCDYLSLAFAHDSVQLAEVTVLDEVTLVVPEFFTKSSTGMLKTVASVR
jgi:hypothetical protein